MRKASQLLSLLFAIVLMLALAIAALAQPSGPQFPVISADALKAELDSGGKIFVVDARSMAEYAQGHLPGAVSVPTDGTVSLTGALPKDKSFPIVFYCRGWG
ncbi:hypothetical protein LCGC14_2445410 [marine sediment metagenome]|uniref:Rhodanese domain-containing protein n=1 Tax=marine sediment metagenome TaxID=412755 RepID=A0A0F9BHU8_9ZZZZ